MKKLLLFLALLPMMVVANESGTCGENLSWSYIETTKTLKISGSGDMHNYNWGNTPWFNYRFSITNVEIESGITSIGNNAFMGIQYLNSITIPESVKTIGEAAFRGCSSLKDITLPNSIDTLSEGIFRDCSGLASISIPNSITSIGGGAFYGCCGLTTITLPKNLTSIGTGAFQNCSSLQSVIVLSSPRLPYVTDPFSGCPNIREVIFDCDTVTALFRNITALEKVTLSDKVTAIGDNAFSSCVGLSSVEIPDGVISIGSSAFYGCNNLSSITIPNSVTSIGEGAFRYCTGLTSIVISSSLKVLRNYTFEGCTGLNSLSIPEGVTSIGTSTYSGCTSLASISIPGSVTSIGTSAFSGCSEMEQIIISQDNPTYDSRNNCNAIIETESNNLIIGCKNSTIPEGVVSIGIGAFANCEGITSLTLPNSLKHIKKSAFSGCSSLTSINIPENVTEINEEAFYNCSSLESLIIPNSVISIGRSAFRNCSNIEHIDNHSCITYIEQYTFSSCTSLISVTIPEDVNIISASAFEGCKKLQSIRIPNKVYTIGGNAFKDCCELKSITIGSGLTTFTPSVFSGCSELESIVVDENNPIYDSRDNCNAIIMTTANAIMLGCNTSTIPNSVISIRNSAFSGCTGLTSLSFSKNINWIDQNAFSGCSGLTSLSFSNGKVTIGNNAFSECTSLSVLSIPDVVNASDESEPYSYASIGKYAFSGCTHLSSLYIPNFILSIDETSFNNCDSLATIIVSPENPKYDSRDNCNAIIETSTNKLIVGSRNTIIPQSVTDYGQYGLVNCVNLKLPAGMEEIPINFLLHCKNLESITIPNSIKKINDLSFYGCSNLKTIVIEDGTEELTFETVYSYSGYQPKWYKDNPLDSIYIGRNYRTSYYEYYPFQAHPTLRAVAFGETVTDIPRSQFNGCSNLKNVKLSDNTKTIGDNTFSACVNLQSIEFGSKLETIGSSAFYNCLSFDTIVIPSNIKAIGPDAFYCSHISSLIIEDGEDLDLYNGSKGIEFKGGTIDSLYLGRSNVNIVSDSIKHVTIGKIKKLVGFGGKTINVLDIIEASDTLRIPVYQNSSYAGGRINYYYTTPFNNITIDSLYCNRIVSVYDTYNENSTVHPFEGVTSSFKLEIGKNLTEIGDGMFYGCKIPSLFIPNNIKRISPTAFNNCYTLSSVTIEDSTEPLDFGGGDNFYGCQLRNIYLGRNMQYSTNSPFNRNKEGICNIVFGDNVTDIPENAFLGLKNVNALSLPPNLKKIGKQAFYGCESMTTLTIPGSVTEIEQQAFDLCRSLKTLSFEDGTETLDFTASGNNLNNAFTNSPIENLYLGRNISFSYSSPLGLFETLKTLTFGDQVTNVPNKAFIGCPNLKDVTSYAKTVPTTGEVVFTPSYLPTATLHVPYELYSQYKVTPQWKDFGNIVNFEGLYNLTYIVDGEVYKDSVVEQNSQITPEAEPTKDYYTFSGWSEIPDSMPAHDVTITGSFVPNKYKLIYQVDGIDYNVYDIAYGSVITPEADPVKEGYTFSGWSEVPDTMPGHDVTVTGTFSINSYDLTYMIDEEVYKVVAYNYGAAITPEPQPEGDYESFEWVGLPETMPAHDVTVHASYVTGITDILMTEKIVRIYSPNGKVLKKPQKGLNLVLMRDGTIRKIVLK